MIVALRIDSQTARRVALEVFDDILNKEMTDAAFLKSGVNR